MTSWVYLFIFLCRAMHKNNEFLLNLTRSRFLFCFLFLKFCQTRDGGRGCYTFLSLNYKSVSSKHYTFKKGALAGLLHSTFYCFFALHLLLCSLFHLFVCNLQLIISNFYFKSENLHKYIWICVLKGEVRSLLPIPFYNALFLAQFACWHSLTWASQVTFNRSGRVLHNEWKILFM